MTSTIGVNWYYSSKRQKITITLFSSLSAQTLGWWNRGPCWRFKALIDLPNERCILCILPVCTQYLSTLPDRTLYLIVFSTYLYVFYISYLSASVFCTVIMYTLPFCTCILYILLACTCILMSYLSAILFWYFESPTCLQLNFGVLNVLHVCICILNFLRLYFAYPTCLHIFLVFCISYMCVPVFRRCYLSAP